MSISPKFLKITDLLLTLLLISNLYLKITPLGISCGILWLLINSLLIGAKFFPLHSSLFKIWAGLGLIISFIAAGGGIIYFCYQLNNPVIIALIAIIAFISLTARTASIKLIWPKLTDQFSWRKLSLTIAYLLSTANCFYLLFTARTFAAIRTPWQVIPAKFFWFYFLSTLILIIIILKTKKYFKLTLILIILQLAITVFLTPIIYPLGFGFDSFIHQATEKVIADKGLITPKPFYYLGQYSLVVFIAKIMTISPTIIDKLLLGILSLLYLPMTIFYSLKRTVNLTNRKILLLTFLLSLIPLPFITNTNPYGIASVYLIIILLITLLYNHFNQSNKLLALIAFLTLTAAVIHPIVGLPLIIFILCLIAGKKINRPRPRIVILIILFLTMSAIIPAAFSLNSKFNGAPITLQYQGFNLIKQFDFHPPTLPTRFNIIYDFVYAWQYNWKWLLIAISLIGLIYLIKQRQANYSPIIISAALIINSFIIAVFIQFKSIINYEQIDYSNRIFELSFYSLLPLFLIGMIPIIALINNQSKYYKIFFIILAAVIITSALYLSFPRNDKYVIGRGFNVSASDKETVKLIASLNKDDNYVVLSNQSVSAAALEDFGFKKYFSTTAGGLFYYPIPTSSPLYQIYLDMVYNSFDKKNSQKAKDVSGAATVYVVVNDYWSDFKKIVEDGKKNAVNFWEVDGGKNFVFEF